MEATYIQLEDAPVRVLTLWVLGSAHLRYRDTPKETTPVAHVKTSDGYWWQSPVGTRWSPGPKAGNKTRSACFFLSDKDPSFSLFSFDP